MPLNLRERCVSYRRYDAPSVRADRGIVDALQHTGAVAFPTRPDVERALAALVEGRVTAQGPISWAAPFVVDESSHTNRIDEAVWDALNNLYRADLEQAPGGRG